MQRHDTARRDAAIQCDHVKALNDHMEQPFIDTILINNEEIPDEIKSKYAKELPSTSMLKS